MPPKSEAVKPHQIPGNISRILLIIVGIGFLLRLIHFWAISRTAYPRIPLIPSELDMYAFWQWAQTILAGDWLGRNTYHPYFQWMQDMAPLETWYRWWGGKEIFQQAPFYAYWLAGLFALSNNSPEFVLFVQLMIGGLQPLVMYGVARRLFDHRVGLVAAALTACYGPFIFHQGTLLRDWLPPLLNPLALLLTLRAQETKLRRDWCFAGACFGVAVLTKESILFFIPLVLIWLVFQYRQSLRRLAEACAMLLLGFCIAFLPLVVRNLAVGAPIFAISSRALEGFIEGNAPDANPIGLNHPPSMPEILERSNGQLSHVVYETLARYDGDWLLFSKQMTVKLWGIADPLEISNDTDFYYVSELSPVLQLTLPYGLIFPIGFAGLLLSLKHWRRHLLLVLYGLSALGALMSGIILGRYRLEIMPILIIYGAAGIVLMVDAAIAGRFGKALIGLVLISLATTVQHRIPLVMPHFPHLPEYWASSQVYLSQGKYDRAVGEMLRLREKETAVRSMPSVVFITYFAEGWFRILWANQLFDQGNREGGLNQARLAQTALAEYFDGKLSFKTLSAPTFDLRDPGHITAFINLLLEIDPKTWDDANVRRFIRHLER